MLGHEGFAQLLRGPSGRRMSCGVDMEDAPGADLHDHECVDRAKGCRRGYDEVAGLDGPGRGSARTSTTLDHVLGPPRGSSLPVVKRANGRAKLCLHAAAIFRHMLAR